MKTVHRFVRLVGRPWREVGSGSRRITFMINSQNWIPYVKLDHGWYSNNYGISNLHNQMARLKFNMHYLWHLPSYKKWQSRVLNKYILELWNHVIPVGILGRKIVSHPCRWFTDLFRSVLSWQDWWWCWSYCSSRYLILLAFSFVSGIACSSVATLQKLCGHSMGTLSVCVCV